MVAEIVICSVILIFVVYGSLKFKTFINPLSFYGLTLFLSLSGVLLADSLADSLGLRASISGSISNVAYLYFISMFVFAIPWALLRTNTVFKYVIINDSRDIKLHVQLLSLALIFVLLLVMLIIGRFPLYEMISGGLTIQEHIDSLASLPIGFMALISMLTVLFILFFSSIVANRKDYGINNYTLLFLSLLLIIACVWQGTRQFILLSLFMIIIRKIEYENIKLRHYLFLGLSVMAFIAIFIIIQKIRLQGEGTHSYELLMYLAWPPLNLNSIVENFDSSSITFTPQYILWEIIPNRLFGKDLMANLGYILYVPSSPSGYLSLWYMDFGIIGVVIGSLLLSLLSMYAFKRKDRSENDLRIYNMFLWVCITSSVYSHLLHLNFFIAPVVALVIYGKISKRVLYRKSGMIIVEPR